METGTARSRTLQSVEQSVAHADVEAYSPHRASYAVVSNRRSLRRVLIVGTDHIARKIAIGIGRDRSGERQVVGFVATGSAGGSSMPPILGQSSDIPRLVDECSIDEVIVSDPASCRDQVIEGVMGEGRRPLQVRVVPSIYESMLGAFPLDTIDDVPLVQLCRCRSSKRYDRIRSILEMLIAALILVITTPLLLVTAFAVKATSRGPLIFRQERVGLNGKVFTLYKVRTMVDGAESESGPTWSFEGDDRVTPIGRFLRATRIDELPQLINVLRGDMSLVGPRPERPCFVQEFRRTIACYDERHRVRPGITGMAQVYGDYSTSPETKLRYDLMYVYNRSLYLDVKIPLLTFRAILRERTGRTSRRARVESMEVDVVRAEEHSLR